MSQVRTEKVPWDDNNIGSSGQAHHTPESLKPWLTANGPRSLFSNAFAIPTPEVWLVSSSKREAFSPPPASDSPKLKLRANLSTRHPILLL